MSAIGDYLRDTRAELNHVAWPTRTQTIVYTILVIVISVGIAAYLGFFDYIFTGTLTHVVNVLPAQQQNTGALQVTQTPAQQPSQAQPSSAPSFNLGTSTNP